MIASDPLAAAARLARARGRVVLQTRGWSFVTAAPTAALLARGRSLVRLDARGRAAQRFTGDPLAAIDAFLAEHACTHDPLVGPPAPRVFGFLAYDLARVIADLPGRAATGAASPDVWLAAYPAVARWAPGAAAPELVGDDPAALTVLGAALARPAAPTLAPSLGAFVTDDDAAHDLARRARAEDHLAAGELHQIFLARRLVARITAPGDPLAIFAALAPLPHRALIEADALAVIAGGSAAFSPGRAPSAAAALRAGFPADAVTGAPRLRAMQLIDDLERVRRGAYAGVFGAFGPTGSQLAVSQRAGVLTRDDLRVYAGAMIDARDALAAAPPDRARDPAADEVAAWTTALGQLTVERARPPRSSMP